MKCFSHLLAILLTAAVVAWTSPALAADEHTTAARDTAPGAVDNAHKTADAHAPAGDPQLVKPINEGLITAITTLVVFLGLVVVLGKFAWGPIASGLQAREEKIRGDIKDAEEARARAEGTLKQYQQQLAAAEAQVRDLIAKAQRDGEQIATNIKMKAQQDAEEIKEKANKEIDSAKGAAVREVYQSAADLSTNIAEKILRRNLNPQDQADLINKGIEEFQAVASKG